MAGSLRVALANVAGFAIAAVALYIGIIPEPWDLAAVCVLAIICPIGGVWFAVSTSRREVSQGSSKVQPAIALALSLSVFVIGLLLLASIRP